MIIRKVMLATAVMALASTPAWALPAKAPENEGTSHATHTAPNYASNPGSKRRSERGTTHAGGAEHGAKHSTSRRDSSSGHGEKGKAHSEKGKAHRCMAHKRGYVVAGILASGELTPESEEGAKHPTYMGTLTVEVKRTNHHAREAKGTTQEYAVKHVHLHGNVSPESLAEGDRVRLIGKVTFMHKKCESAESEFTPEVTIHRIIVHPPKTTTETTP